jgi:hypothetical protein
MRHLANVINTSLLIFVGHIGAKAAMRMQLRNMAKHEQESPPSVSEERGVRYLYAHL